MTDTRKVIRLMEQVAARARGGQAPVADGRTVDRAVGEAGDGDGTPAVAAPAPPPAPAPAPAPPDDFTGFTRDRLSDASALASAGTHLPPDARLKPVKQAILTLVRPVTSHQVPFNEQLMAAIEGLVREVERLAGTLATETDERARLEARLTAEVDERIRQEQRAAAEREEHAAEREEHAAEREERARQHAELEASVARHEQRAARLQASIATTDLSVDDLDQAVKGLDQAVEGVDQAVQRVDARLSELMTTVERVTGDLDARWQQSTGDLAAQLATVRAEAHAVRAKQDLVFRAAREALPGGFDPAQLDQLSRELSTEYDELYEDLEDRFRGTREHVKAMAADFLDDVRTVQGRAPVVDVGCGRGEWLETLRDADIEAYGVDTNEVVVERCRARGLDVRTADALVHLRQVPEGSVRAVTSFHVVEHLSLDMFVQLVDAALLALTPGGLLIFETPNPTNLNVGAASFYLDPTHLKPLHPQFSEFLVLSRGFAEAEVRYLHQEEGPRIEPADLAGSPDGAREQQLADRLNWAMFGPLDYAVIARKADPAARRSKHES